MNLPSDNLEVEVANSIDFMVERVRCKHLSLNSSRPSQLEAECTHAQFQVDIQMMM